MLTVHRQVTLRPMIAPSKCIPQRPFASSLFTSKLFALNVAIHFIPVLMFCTSYTVFGNSVRFLLYYYTITHWPLTLKTFLAMPLAYMVNICSKFHSGSSTKSRGIDLNGRTAVWTDNPQTRFSSPTAVGGGMKIIVFAMNIYKLSNRGRPKPFFSVSAATENVLTSRHRKRNWNRYWACRFGRNQNRNRNFRLRC